MTSTRENTGGGNSIPPGLVWWCAECGKEVPEREVRPLNIGNMHRVCCSGRIRLKQLTLREMKLREYARLYDK